MEIRIQTGLQSGHLTGLWSRPQVFIHPTHTERHDVPGIDQLAGRVTNGPEPGSTGVEVGEEDVGEVVTPVVADDPVLVIERLHDAHMCTTPGGHQPVPSHASLGLDRGEVLGVVQDRHGVDIGA